jgi:hypothetical protein
MTTSFQKQSEASMKVRRNSSSDGMKRIVMRLKVCQLFCGCIFAYVLQELTLFGAVVGRKDYDLATTTVDVEEPDLPVSFFAACVRTRRQGWDTSLILLEPGSATRAVPSARLLRSREMALRARATPRTDLECSRDSRRCSAREIEGVACRDHAGAV